MPRRPLYRRPPLSTRQLLLFGFGVAIGLGFLVLIQMFYTQNTHYIPRVAGTYIEGSVGEMRPLNPWFTVTNDVNRDLVSLIFAGLMKYNPETKQIEEDLATMKVSTDGQYYTLTLKDDLYWHDSTPESPHPVTVDDVLFTFETIQDPQFPNTLLKQNFRGVKIEQLDDRTVRFALDEPYQFFSSNLTLGLLPRRSFEGIPVERIDETIGFGFAPIGAGPYSFKGLVQTELSTEVTLERFDRSIPPTYHLKQLVFRIFPDYPTLLSDLRNLHGVRLVPRNDEGDPLVPKRFTASQYSLPQYVAMFLNMESDLIADPQLRLALQLGTNKQAIADDIHETEIVDTPLLEIDTSDWRYEFDATAAQGALFDSDWHLPEKVRLQRLLEQHDANRAGVLQLAPVVYLQTGAGLTVTGAITDVGSTGGSLNISPLTVDTTNTGHWIAILPTAATGGLQLGMNVVRLYDDSDQIVDSFYLWRAGDTTEYKLALREQDVLKTFLASRAGELPEEERITVADMFLEQGMLRLRKKTDPTDIRINERGDRLTLKLLTSPSPPQYPLIAEAIASQWKDLGIHVGIEIPETKEEFQEQMLRRDYDVLLFGQSLLDNLDSYPYWHSSGIQKDTVNRSELRLDAYNLSQYQSLDADTLLELIRTTSDEDERKEALDELRGAIKTNVPAIFLYSPLYTYAYHQNVQGISLGNLSLHSDRFLTLHRWFVQEKRVFLPGKTWLNFPSWLISLLF